MRDWRKAVVSRHASIREAIAAIDAGVVQVALVVDDEERFVGLTTDGDIRRGILNGIDLESPIESVMNANAIRVSQGQTRAQVRELMRAHHIYHVPVLDGQGRLVDLQMFDEIVGGVEKSNPVVLLAGGLGSRLSPHTAERPKPLVEVGGQPILHTIIERLARAGFRRLFLAVNYKAHMIEEYCGDGARWGVQIEYLQERQRLGTAGPLGLLSERPAKPLLVMNGDVLTKVDFEGLLQFHDRYAAAATTCVREFDVQVPYGVVKADGHQLEGIDEKPVLRFFVNAGVYVLDPRCLDLVPRDEFMDMPDLLMQVRAAGNEVIVFPIHEYWIDVGNPEDLQVAGSDYLSHFPGSTE